MSTKEKPKRSRKSAPKVRTGCLTCKTRHIKCGEEKPICLRCSKDGFTCDGYREPATITSSVVRPSKRPLTLQIPSHLDWTIAGSALEKFYFHHIRHFAIEQLALSTTDAKFWQQIVLPNAHSDDSIRHALVALGMAHRTFMDSPGVENLDELVLQQYNAAIRHLTKDPTTKTHDTRQIVLCCLVFYCLDSIMGRYAQSLQHLRAGSKLLGAHLKQSKKVQSSQSGDNELILQRITDMLATIGVDAGFFLDENLIADLEYNSVCTIEDDVLENAFTSLVAARRSLNSILVDSNHTFELYRDDWYAPEMCKLYERFKLWAARFDRSNFQFASGTPSPSEQHDLVAMRLARKLWLAIIDSGLPYPQLLDKFNDLFGAIIDEAEALLKQTPSSCPVFTLQADIVPHVAYVCELTSDPAIQRRALDLLRSVKRREGIWDSQEVADYLEDYLLAKSMIPINWDIIPGGLPGSVRALQGLSLSNLNPSNNIVQLATDPEGLGVPPPVFKDNVLMGYAHAKSSSAWHPESYAAKARPGVPKKQINSLIGSLSHHSSPHVY